MHLQSQKLYHDGQAVKKGHVLNSYGNKNAQDWSLNPCFEDFSLYLYVIPSSIYFSLLIAEGRSEADDFHLGFSVPAPDCWKYEVALTCGSDFPCSIWKGLI